MPKFKMAATDASADQFESDLGGSHFLATKRIVFGTILKGEVA